jgi:hypothetical protein
MEGKMEIKVVCSAAVTSGINDGFIPGVKICGNLKDAFWFKDYLEQDSEAFGFAASVILQTARRAIEVRKDHPRYRVMVDGNSRDVLTDDFNLAMLRVMKFWENDRHAVLERWRVYGNGVKRWEPIG